MRAPDVIYHFASSLPTREEVQEREAAAAEAAARLEAEAEAKAAAQRADYARHEESRRLVGEIMTTASSFAMASDVDDLETIRAFHRKFMKVFSK